MKKPFLLLVALVASLALAACGGDTADKNEYIDKVNAAQKEFTDGAGKLNLANPGSPAEFGKSLDSLTGLVDKLVNDLNGIEPPEEVTGEHDKLVNSMKTYGDVLNKNKDAFTGKDQQKIQTAAQEIATASSTFSKDFSGTIDTINKKLRE